MKPLRERTIGTHVVSLVLSCEGVKTSYYVHIVVCPMCVDVNWFNYLFSRHASSLFFCSDDAVEEVYLAIY